MFYTKYRPQKFSEIIKPNEAAEALAREVKNGKTVHAYLFVGPRGTGKTTVARILAKSLNCEKLESDGDPCDKCDSCVSIREGYFPDLMEIDAASNRGIDDIRELKDRVRLAPSRGKRKIYIIDEVHMLTSEAFNALLKTLEEPPKNTVFILCTTESHKVPDTIKSRCQIFKFKRASIIQIVDKLKKIAKEEKITISDSDLNKIAQVSLGGFRDAETLFQQLSEGELDIKSLLSIGSREIYLEFVQDILDGNVSHAFKTIDKVFEEGVDLNLWAGELLNHMRQLLFIKSGAVGQIEDLTEELLVDVKKQAGQIDLMWLSDSLGRLSEAHRAIKSSFIPQLPLEIFITESVLDLSGNSVNTGSGGPKQTEPKPGSNTESPKLQKKVLPESGADSEGRGTKTPVESGGKLGVEQEDIEVPEKVVKVIKKQEAKVSADDEDLEPEVESVEQEKETAEPPLIALEAIENGWKDVLKQSKELNHSINALLKSGKPTGVEGRFLLFEVSYPFHKERLESHKNREMVERLLKDIFEVDIKVKCTLCKERPKSKHKDSEVLTDYNVSLPPIEGAALLDVFDGGLPALG